jgi:hypothetical protein
MKKFSVDEFDSKFELKNFKKIKKNEKFLRILNKMTEDCKGIST